MLKVSSWRRHGGGVNGCGLWRSANAGKQLVDINHAGDNQSSANDQRQQQDRHCVSYDARRPAARRGRLYDRPQVFPVVDVAVVNELRSWLVINQHARQGDRLVQPLQILLQLARAQDIAGQCPKRDLRPLGQWRCHAPHGRTPTTAQRHQRPSPAAAREPPARIPTRRARLARGRAARLWTWRRTCGSLATTNAAATTADFCGQCTGACHAAQQKSPPQSASPAVP